MQDFSASKQRRRRSFFKRLLAGCRYLINTRVWGMDIEPGCEIERSAWIDRTWPRGVHIGSGSYVGLEAVILTHDFTRGIYLDTRIGKGCIIGARAIVMPGCTVGDGSIIHPGAIVTKDVPAGSTAIGNPARTSFVASGA